LISDFKSRLRVVLLVIAIVVIRVRRADPNGS